VRCMDVRRRVRSGGSRVQKIDANGVYQLPDGNHADAAARQGTSGPPNIARVDGTLQAVYASVVGPSAYRL
jgi:hypothetical protein